VMAIRDFWVHPQTSHRTGKQERAQYQWYLMMVRIQSCLVKSCCNQAYRCSFALSPLITEFCGLVRNREVRPSLAVSLYQRLQSKSTLGLCPYLLYCPRMKSEICSSFACSTADSLLWSPWPNPYCWTASIPM